MYNTDSTKGCLGRCLVLDELGITVLRRLIANLNLLGGKDEVSQRTAVVVVWRFRQIRYYWTD
jgi:hypothetical protein